MTSLDDLQIRQKTRLLGLLKNAGTVGVSPLDALREINCFRLAARIHELRKQGHKIRTEYHVRDGKQFGVYVLDE